MSRLVVAVDRGAGMSPAAWDGDEEARAAGAAEVEAARPGDFFGVVDLVVARARAGRR